MANRQIFQHEEDLLINDECKLLEDDTNNKTKMFKLVTLKNFIGEFIKEKIPSWEYGSLKTKGKNLIESANEIYDTTQKRMVSMEEIDLVTEEGFFVDALAVKELNRNLNEGFSPLTSDVNGIFKHSSGLMLQWGIYPSAAMTKNDGVGGYLGKITFKESFTGTPQCFTTCHYWGGNTQTGTQDISSTSVTLFSKASATDLGVRWLALGSWK